MRLSIDKIRKGAYLEDGKEFIANSMTASYVKGVDWTGVSYGRMDTQPKIVLRREMAANPDQDFYIVFSYITPIAWRMGRGEWRIPPDTYSVTTKRHQNLVIEAARQGGVKEWTELIG